MLCFLIIIATSISIIENEIQEELMMDGSNSFITTEITEINEKSKKQIKIMIPPTPPSLTYSGVIEDNLNLKVISKQLQQVEPEYFVSLWDTRLLSEESSNSTQIKLPLVNSGTYDFIVNWGDNNTNHITDFNQNDVTHTYSDEGIYTVTISGNISGWRFNDSGDRLKLLEVAQWGNLYFGNLGDYFHGAENLKITAKDIPNLKGISVLDRAFKDAINLGKDGNFNQWNVSDVTTMVGMFQNARTFNQPLNDWDVSNVKDMWGMFFYAESFNQPLNDWNTSNVEIMTAMLFNARSFNQQLDNWNTSRITDMSNMFMDAVSFNQSLNDWDVSKVVNMRSMFFSAKSFNQPLNNWDVSKVIDMNGMFFGAKSFDHPLGDWNVSLVKDMEYMFWDVKLSTMNYDDLLLGWSELDLRKNVVFHAGESQYSSKANGARSHILKTYGWIISDGGSSSLNISFVNYHIFTLISALIIAVRIKNRFTFKNE
jgi:surface protein